MPHLQQLELIVSSGGSINLFEGDQWEIFIKNHLPYLSIFNFKFKLINIDREKYNEKSVLTQFRSPFWLNRNPGWYVAYNIDDFILYTIPHFVPRTIKHSLFSNSPDLTTLPIEKYFIYYNQINELELDSNCKSSYRYTHVQRLILSITMIDENVIDLAKVEYLCVKSSSWSLKKLFRIIKNSMVRLYHLKIDYKFPTIQSCDIVPLEQIRILELPQFSCSLGNDNIDLSYLFPCVEYLTIEISNIDQMTHLIDRFMYLSSVSFHIINDQNDTNHTFTEPDMIRKLLIEKTNRLARNSNFTYRLDSQSDVWIHLWINSENTQPKKLSNTTLRNKQLMSYRETDCQCGCLLQ